MAPMRKTIAAWTALAVLFGAACSREAPQPILEAASVSTAIPPAAAGSTPPAEPSAAPTATPTAAATVDPMTCHPHPPAVRFEVVDDDVVRPFDAAGCGLGESHFKANGYAYKASVDFFTEVQRRLAAGDKPGVAELANYPLRANLTVKRAVIAKDRAALVRDFDRLFTPAVIKTILEADPRDVFCNYQGIMLANGVLWADNADGKHLGLITINP
jgi:hypothetical protein